MAGPCADQACLAQLIKHPSCLEKAGIGSQALVLRAQDLNNKQSEHLQLSPSYETKTLSFFEPPSPKYQLQLRLVLEDEGDDEYEDYDFYRIQPFIRPSAASIPNLVRIRASVSPFPRRTQEGLSYPAAFASALSPTHIRLTDWPIIP